MDNYKVSNQIFKEYEYFIQAKFKSNTKIMSNCTMYYLFKNIKHEDYLDFCILLRILSLKYIQNPVPTKAANVINQLKKSTIATKLFKKHKFITTKWFEEILTNLMLM